MPKIRYVGPFDSVTLALNGIEVQRKHQVEVDDETYASLIEQTDWEAVESKPAKKAPAKSPAKKATASLVGEAGPELVVLSDGEHIHPASSGEPDEGDKS